VGAVVLARGLVKRYGDLTAVDHIDLDIPPGITFGVLGPNGAGKTTTMKMITCVSPPTEGTLEVLGADVRGDRRSLKRRIGVVPQGMTLDMDLNVRENLVAQGMYHGLGRRLAGERADEYLEFAALTDRADATTDELSGGMQRRLLVARALVSDPELVVLDEPTTGLDPQARHHVWERLRSLKRAGKTLILTTHYMDEAARLCDQLVVVDKGRIIAAGTPDELVAAHVPPQVVELIGAAMTVDELKSVLGSKGADAEEVGDRLLVYTDGSLDVERRVRKAGVGVDRVLLRESTLEDVFLRLTGHSLTE